LSHFTGAKEPQVADPWASLSEDGKMFFFGAITLTAAEQKYFLLGYGRIMETRAEFNFSWA